MEKETKNKFMNDWFFNQWFSKEELEKMWNWSQISNTACAYEMSGNDPEHRWVGYLTEDKNHEIELVSMGSKEMCENWIKRLGFNIDRIMKKLTKAQLKKIANMHAAGVLLATESFNAFEGSNLSSSEIEYLDRQFEKTAINLLDGEDPIYDANCIVDYVRQNYK